MIPNILGSIIHYNHQPTEVLNINEHESTLNPIQPPFSYGFPMVLLTLQLFLLFIPAHFSSPIAAALEASIHCIKRIRETTPAERRPWGKSWTEWLVVEPTPLETCELVGIMKKSSQLNGKSSSHVPKLQPD